MQGKTLQALFDKLKTNHAELKEEFKELCRRSVGHAEITCLKSVLLEFPPLHGLNDIFEDLCITPKTKMARHVNTPRNNGTAATSAIPKRRSGGSAGVSATKSLKFSPHLLKTEPTTSGGNDYSRDGVLELTTTHNGYKADEEDDIIEIDGV